MIQKLTYNPLQLAADELDVAIAALKRISNSDLSLAPQHKINELANEMSRLEIFATAIPAEQLLQRKVPIMGMDLFSNDGFDAKNHDAVRLDTLSEDELKKYAIAYQPLFEAKGARLICDFSANVRIAVDTIHFSSVIDIQLNQILESATCGSTVVIQSRIHHGSYCISATLDAESREYFPSPEYRVHRALAENICAMYGWVLADAKPNAGQKFNLFISDYCITDDSTTAAQRQIEQNRLIGLASLSGNFLHKPTLLLVEPNQELRDFLTTILSDDYKIISAANGASALALAIDEIPDLIVSDILLPEMDGLCLLQSLNEHDNTSHIPLIFLTALKQSGVLIKALSLGCIDCIAKPFVAAELLLKIRNSLQKKRALTQSVLQRPLQNYSHAAIPERERRFVNRLNQTIETYIADSTLSVTKLADAVAMSERQLQRKLKAIFGQTPAEYMNDFRLSFSCKLLAEGFSITDAADRSGFSSNSYFSKSFKKKFGIPPSLFLSD